MQIWHTNVTAREISNVVITTAVIHNSILFIYHLIKTLPCVSKYRFSYMHKISLFTLFMIILYDLEYFRHLYFINPSVSWWSCAINIKICAVLWVISKMAGYWFFTERLFVVFQGTKLRFPKYQIYLARSLFIINPMATITIIIFFVHGM